MKKKLSIILLILCVLVVAPLMSACSLFDINFDDLYEQLQEEFDYNGTYVVEEYYENLNKVEIVNQSACFNVYEIKDNSTLNVIHGTETLETFQIEGCICGNIDFSDRNDISGMLDNDGKLTITRIFDDKTIRLVCARAVGAPSKLLGTYSFFSFRRGASTIYEQPINSNYPEENTYFEQSQLSFVIGENNTLTTLCEDVEQKSETFYFTDSNLILTSSQRLTYSTNTLSNTKPISENLNCCFAYKTIDADASR